MRVLLKEATGERPAWPRTQRVFARHGQADLALSGLIALVKAMQDRGHEWNGAENRNLPTVR
jgi:hypothetical protein